MVAEKNSVSVTSGMPTTIRLGGVFAARHTPEILAAFHEAVARNGGCVHLDAGAVRVIDETCVRALAEAVRVAEAGGVAVKMIHASRRLREMLRDLGRQGWGKERIPASRESNTPPEVGLDLPCMPQAVALIRGHVAEIASKLTFTSTELDDIVLAVGEAAANAVRHGIRFGQECSLRVRCRIGDDCLTVEITDPGDGFDPETLRPPSVSASREGGLGIYLMRRIMDEVTYTFDARGTTVRLVKHGSLPLPRERPDGRRGKKEESAKDSGISVV